MIELLGVGKSYRFAGQAVHAVREATLSVGPGEFVSIVGHSGSGKSTLLSLVGAITRPDSGSVGIEGVDPWSLGDAALSLLRNRTFGFVYQFASLVPTLTALENVLVPLELTGGGGPDALARATSLLERVGLGDRLDHYPAQLSGGEQQRVAIARAFANRPRILFADEPTGNLDADTGGTIIDLLVELNAVEGSTLVLVTHDPALADRAGRIVRLRSGSIIENRKNGGA